MSAMPSLAESRPATLLQTNQAEGINGAGAENQPQQRNPTNNANFFFFFGGAAVGATFPETADGGNVPSEGV